MFDYSSLPKVAKGCANFGITSYLMPVPVSIISNFTIFAFVSLTISSIYPLLVNLTALPMILINIYFNRF